ncbi:MAG: hypothetical protein AABZ44_00235 [Elusimicrobiota bacterium]
MNLPPNPYRSALRALFSPKDYFEDLRQGRVGLRISIAIMATAVILASLFYAYKPDGFPADSISAQTGSQGVVFWFIIGAIGAGLGVISAYLSVLILRFVDRNDISAVAVMGVMFSAHVYYIVLFIILIPACVWKLADFYKTAEMAASLAGLIFTVAGIRAVARVTIGKAMLATFLSSVVVAALVFGTYLLELLPADILKALFFV